MTRLRLFLAGVALLLTVVAVRLVWTATHRDRDDGSGAARAAAQGARVAAQLARTNRTVSVPVPVEVPAVAVPAAPTYTTEVERRFASSGASRAEIDVMKQSWPDWETRFAGSSDDMVKAHLARVRPLVPATIPNEIARVAAVDVDHVVAQSMARQASGVGDDLAHLGAGGASVVDDIGRAGSGVARSGAGMLDDVLRVLGLGGAGAAAAAAAAASKRKK